MRTEAQKKLKEGITTGTCAAAAAAAAVAAYFGRFPRAVGVALPDGAGKMFVDVHSTQTLQLPDGGKAISATVIKYAGDDPDITHGAQIGARVSIVANDSNEIKVRGGPGVGKVTRPGLPVPVGASAINPVPRKMIAQEVAKRLPKDKCYSVSVEIFVKDGALLSQRTLNPRLGIVGGISILGTTGIVKPFSARSYRDTIDICLRSARAGDQKTCVLSTGRRSERLAQAHYPRLDERCFVQIADFFFHALKTAVALGFAQIVLVGFFGKLCKWAMNMMYTHAASGHTDFGYLSRLAHETGRSEGFCAFVSGANNARHIFTAGCQEVPLFVETIGQKALHNAGNMIHHAAAVTICLWDYDERLYKKWKSTALR